MIALAVVLSGAARRGGRGDADRRSTPLVTAGLRAHGDTIVVLVGVVVGGIDRLWTATLGGFSIGFASGAAQRR